MRQANRSSWTTENEINAIRSFGMTRPEKREKILRGYIHAAQYRHDWGDIDKVKAVEFAEEILRQVCKTS
jgi:hypothetical protein